MARAGERKGGQAGSKAGPEAGPERCPEEVPQRSVSGPKGGRLDRMPADPAAGAFEDDELMI